MLFLNSHCKSKTGQGSGVVAPSFTNTNSVLFTRSGSEYAVQSSPSSHIGSGITTVLTASVWVKTTETTSVIVYPFVSHYVASGNQAKWWFGMQGSGLSTGRLRLVTSSDGAAVTIHDQSTGATVNDGSWHHVAVTYNGAGNVVLYVDGSSVYSASASVASLFNNTAEFAIAKVTGGGGGLFWTGNADEVSIFNAELSGAEISAIYNSGSPADLSSHSRAANLQGWWRMGDGDTYPTLTDQQGNNNLTMTSMASGDIVADVP